MKAIRDRAKEPKSKTRKTNPGMTESEAILSDIEPESLTEAETVKVLARTKVAAPSG